MSWLRSARPVLLAVAAVAVVGSLLGSRFLAHGSGGGADPNKSAAPPTNGKDGSGPVVLGYVDSDPPPISHGLPPVMQSGEVVKVYVKAGDEVTAGQELYAFNDRVYRGQLVAAGRAVKVAEERVKAAQALEAQHQTAIDTQTQKLKAAETNARLTKKGQDVYEFNLRDLIKKTITDPAQAADQFTYDRERFKLETAAVVAAEQRDAEQLHLGALQKVNAGAERAVAEAQVELAKAQVESAQTAVDLCVVKALIAGTIEQVNVGPGDVLGVSTRTPAVVLVPAGPRVVRAEVEAEFAHRVGSDKIGQPVTVYDNADRKLAYKGVVRRIGGAFLPKRTTDGGFVPNDTRVLPVLVEVADPAPPGKPPLRVGQKVAVNFGQ